MSYTVKRLFESFSPEDLLKDMQSTANKQSALADRKTDQAKDRNSHSIAEDAHTRAVKAHTDVANILHKNMLGGKDNIKQYTDSIGRIAHHKKWIIFHVQEYSKATK